jgi:hypothetical protein
VRKLLCVLAMGFFGADLVQACDCSAKSTRSVCQCEVCSCGIQAKAALVRVRPVKVRAYALESSCSAPQVVMAEPSCSAPQARAVLVRPIRIRPIRTRAYALESSCSAPQAAPEKSTTPSVETPNQNAPVPAV